MIARKLIGTLELAGLMTTLGTAMAQSHAENPSSSETQRGQLSSHDYHFLVNAARGQQEEIQLGQMAQQKGENQAVRNFGSRMVTDHSKALDGLKQIAVQKGATLPAQMSQNEHSTMQKLQNESGVQFDKTYAREMVKDHHKDVREFEKASKNITDPDLHTWATQTLPILQEHLTLAQQMESQVKNEK